MAARTKFVEYVDQNAESFIERLAQAVKIQSISSDARHRQDVIAMGTWLNHQLVSLGVTTKLVDLGTHVMRSQRLPLPPAILGKLGEDKNKRTVLIYGHYDVQPVNRTVGIQIRSNSSSIKKGGKLIGRGATDDKGPILGWLNVIQAHKSLGLDMPVNLRFCFEGMEENGSEGLDECVIDEVNCVCISDNYWLNTRTPALTYGLRGIAYFSINVTGPGQDLHSGLFGRMVHEPMTDLIKLMSRLVDNNGNILIPGVDEMVPPPTPEEVDLYKKMDYTTADVEEAAGGPIAMSEDKVTALMARMRSPSLSLHGIEGAFSAAGCKTVIPSKVGGKFSIRLVPPQTPEKIIPLVNAYLESEFRQPWVADVKHWNFEAAKRAIEAIYQKTPDYTREGGSIPPWAVNVLLLPMGRADDGAHSTNEKLDRSNFIEGTKVLGTYLYEVAAAM
ncbi:hypothetical protein F5141DRAFT_1186199 [Pisolithus sp. B1]|nr:hypothetical protein F5141DRAFT_1186199 [Pisolithus sp. B1]